ncbi:Maf family nucleotide pyrophosphatase [Idiomarina seosinensis]|uniref:Maf family protein n=1 Tax=Idiomarina seosinensis TaxID=281739 RepID=UPI00384E4D00
MAGLTLVLASSSPYRRAILDKLGLNYQTCKPAIDETPEAGESASQLVQRLAEQKARAAIDKLPDLGDALVIGSDQVALFEQQILGKPITAERAIEQLTGFVGKTVTFLTGLSLYNTRSDTAETICVPFEVNFRSDLSRDELARYVQLEQPLNCAGSFKSEGLGISLFTSLKGDDPNTLIGLPSIELLKMLRKHDVNPLARDNPLA